MGNTNKKLLLSNFKQIKRQSNTIIGAVSHIKIPNSNHQNLILKVFHFNDQIQFEEKSLLFNKIKFLNQSGKLNNLLSIKQIHQSHLSKLCSQTFQLYLFIDYYESDLQTICIEKSIKQKTFSQNQIISIIKSVLNGLISIKKNKLQPPFLSKKCIVFNQKDQIKLVPGNLIQAPSANRYFLHGETKNQSNFPYLSPEVFRLMQYGNFDQNILYNEKATMFTLGMIAVSLAYNHKKLEHNIYKLYNFKSFTFNFLELEKLINNTEYSYGFKQIIKGMVQPNQSLRFGYSNVYQIINNKKIGQIILFSKNKAKKLQRNYNEFSHRSVSKSYASSLTLSIANNNNHNNQFQQKDQQKQIYKLNIENYNSVNTIKRNSSISSCDENYLFQRSKRPSLKISLQSKTYRQEIIAQKRTQLREKYKSCLFSDQSNFNYKNVQLEAKTNIQKQKKPRKYGGISTNFNSVKKNSKQNNDQIQKSKVELISKKPQRRLNEKILKNFSEIEKQNIQQKNLFMPINCLLENKSFSNSLLKQDSSLTQNKEKIMNQFSKNYDKKNEKFKIISKLSKKNNIEQKQNQCLKGKIFSTKKKSFCQIPSTSQNNNVFSIDKKQVQNQLQQVQECNKQKNIKKYFSKKIFNNGARYQGEVQKIQQTYSSKESQIQFQKGSELFNGNGTLYYPNNEICYRGQWINNKFNGFGILYNQNKIIDNNLHKLNYQNFNKNDCSDWIVYQGQFQNDMKHGYGVLKFRNGQKYQGRFIKDCIQGVGVFYTKENNLIRGYWKSGILTKQD